MKRKTARLTAFLMALLIAASVAGCNTGGTTTTTATPTTASTAAQDADATTAGTTSATTAEEKKEKVKLSYWTHLEEPWNNCDDEMIAAFQAINPHITIERESFPYDEFESKTQTSLMSKSGGADLYKLWGGWAIDFAPTGAFAPVPDDFYKDLKDDCYPPVLGAFEYEGKLYGVPLEFNAEWGGMLALKPYFVEHDISYPTTWDEMIAIATEHSKSTGDIFELRGFDFVSADSVCYTWLSMILSAGGQYVTDDGFDFNTPIAIETLQKLADYVTINKVTTVNALTGGDDIENFDRVFMGEALMAPRGLWVLPVGELDYEVFYGTDFDYIPTPFYGPQKKWASETGWGLAVNANAANPDEVWQFVDFLMEPKNLHDINIACGMIPPRKSVAKTYANDVPSAKPIIDVLDGAQYIGNINSDILKEAAADALVDMVSNGTSASQAVLAINDFVN
jgi:multiple sugar transport system substrate-binding protein